MNESRTPIIVILDDEPRMVEMIQMMLRKEGYETHGFTATGPALELLKYQPVDVLISDLKMPDMSGMAVLREAKRLQPGIEVIMITAFATVETAVEAMKQGARDYITKPFPASALKSAVQFALDQRELLLGAMNPEANEPEERTSALKHETPAAAESSDPFAGMIASSAAMREVIKKARKVAQSQSSVLIQGESGVGKEVLARAIHAASPRRNSAWIKINCAAIPETLLESTLFGHIKGSFTGADETRQGLFEASDGGTLFLDEIGEIPLQVQVKLLHVLQEGEFMRVGDNRPIRVDVRVIAATNKNLEEEMRRGAFRQDLYYRLNVVPLYLPPLRERYEDIPRLIDYFVQKYGGGMPISVDEEARDVLLSYPWPGNIREMENAIEHAIVLCDDRRIRVGDLPAALQNFHHKKEIAAAGPSLPAVGEDCLPLEDMEKNSIIRAMQRAGFNHTRAARLLGITRRTLGYRIKKYALDETLDRLKEEWKTQRQAAP